MWLRILSRLERLCQARARVALLRACDLRFVACVVQARSAPGAPADVAELRRRAEREEVRAREWSLLAERAAGLR